MDRRFFCAQFLLTFAASLAVAQNPAPPVLVPTEEYRVRDAVEGSFVQMAAFPVRPMAFDAEGNLWALNHHDSTVRKFTGTGPAHVTYRLPWSPVALAFWAGADKGEPADDVMIVACRGSWCVVEVSVATGEVLHVHQLRPAGTDSAKQGEMAEPGDVLIVDDWALVTCTGADTVLQIDLSVTPRTIHVYGHDLDKDGTPEDAAFEAKAPLFLSADEAGNVYVAPLISGNNTIAHPQAAIPAATDVAKPSNPANGLPDGDLFRIDPATKTLTKVAKSMGTVLFAHGLNPATGDMWMLNTDAFNADLNSEPENNGQFAENRVSIFTLPGGPTPVLQPTTVLRLDPGAPSGGLTGMTAPIGQPFSLTFLDDPSSPAHGHAFLCGLLTDNVLVLDASGSFVRQWTVTLGGALPRQVLLDPTNTKLLVYAWGQNAVRIYDWTTGAHLASRRLGVDPTPASLVPGRNHFFDAGPSRFDNLSCATCHVDGGSDLLAWNLSNVPQDDKGPMITQTLVGIQRMGPFHWRGERDFPDFHRAFKGLLGTLDPITQLPGDFDVEDFGELETFVFSLTNPANPNQSRRRVLDDDLPTPNVVGGEAIAGQAIFNDTNVFAGNTTTCASCHSMPLGTLGDIIDEFPGLRRPRRAQMKPTPFHELWRKEMGKGTYAFGPGIGQVDSAWLGAGFNHIGSNDDLENFIVPITSGSGPQDGLDITAFVHQFDQGVGQAVHYAFLLDAASSPSAVAELQTYLLDQARGRAGDVQGASSRRNCDVVVFGTVIDASSIAQERRWYFDRNAGNGVGIFRCDDPGFTTSGQAAGQRRLLDFLAAAANESNVFLGLPVGMGERFGVDFDLDGHYNAVDSAPDDPTTPGPLGGTPTFVTTNPTAPVQVLWKSSKAARLRFDTSLPTRYDVYVWPVGGTQPPSPQHTSDAYGREHTVLIDGLWPSTNHAAPAPASGAYAAQTLTYNVLVDVVTRAGSSASTSLTVTTDGHKESNAFDPTAPRQRRLLLNHIVDDVDMDSYVASSGNSARTVAIHTAYKRGASYSGNLLVHPHAPDRVVVARAFAQDTTTLAVRPLDRTQVAAVAGTSFLVDRAHLNQLPGSGGPNTELVVGAAPITGAKGVLIVSELATSAGGLTTMDFELLQPLGSNEKVVFSIEAVVHCEPTFNTWSGATAVTAIGSEDHIAIPCRLAAVGQTDLENEGWAQWSFPDTQEDRAQAVDP